MADLSVNTAGLDAVAVNGADIADALDGGDGGESGGGSQPSHSGVAAIRTSMTLVRRAQSARGIEHAGRLQAASAAYRHSDDGSADSITRTI